MMGQMTDWASFLQPKGLFPEHPSLQEEPHFLAGYMKMIHMVQN